MLKGILKILKILKNVQFVTFVWHEIGEIKKKIEKFINIYTMNCFTLDLGRENTQSIYSSTILFSAISFTINMHVQHTYTLSSIS